MSGIHELFGSYAGVIYLTFGPLGLTAAAYVVYRLVTGDSQADAELAPATTVGSESSVHQGQSHRQQMGMAKTAKLSADPPKPAVVAKPPSAEDITKRKVDRLAEIGFHHTVERNTPPPVPTVGGASAGAVVGSASGPANIRPDLNDTPELDDILSRIDKVLSENPLMATATLSAPVQAPSTDRVSGNANSSMDTVTADLNKKFPDEGQQKLF